MMMSFIFVLGLLMLTLLTVRIGCMAVDTVKGRLQDTSLKDVIRNSKRASISDRSGDRHVLELSINGTIMDAKPASWHDEPGSAQEALRYIRSAKDDDNVAGILLQINSGGGGITASDVLWESLRAFKQADPTRVVVVMMGSTAASGAYYIATAADHIVANPTTLTGSIGVIMNSFNIQELAEKVGYKSVTIKSGGNKDILSPFSELTPEQQQMLQAMVDTLHTRFIDIIADGRKLDANHIRTFADGRVFLASEALKLGLIDEIGYVDDAKSEIRRRLGYEPEYIDPNATPSLLQLLRSPSFLGECAARAVQSSAASSVRTTRIDLE